MLQPTPHSSLHSNGHVTSSPPPTTRDAILDAAGTLLGRFGYHKTTMDDLAREAGIARRTLYLHFRSKDDIFLERIDRVVARLLEELRAIATSALPADERLKRMLMTRVMFRFDTVRGYTQCLDEIFQSLRQPYLQRREGYFTAEAAVFARVLEDGVANGDLVASDIQETARALITATSALMPYALSPKELGSRREVERITGRIADLAVAGLRKPGTRSGI
ncbi:MAG: TetR/AcrR family transcriptional regulator [Planctomycetes bacterium]|nr:TetR/AcrR family transcriptional regulator [Planctomycetota bacterium]